MTTKEIIAAADIVEVIGSRIQLKKKGAEHLGLCPFHNDTTPSLSVNQAKGIWKCFGCGEGHDAADFVMKFDRVTFPVALKSLQSGVASGDIPDRTHIPKPPPPPPQVSPVPIDAPAANFVHSRYGAPATVWTYSDASGRIIGHVCRYEPTGAGERKQVLPLTYRLGHGWQFRGFDNPRPLYGLDFLAANPDKTVIIVEGEKTAEFCQRHIPSAVVVTWNGGTENVKNADFSPLFGRPHIILWPDNDYSHVDRKTKQIKPWNQQPGNRAMLEIADILRPHVGGIQWIENPPDKPCGWDAADDEWADGALRNYVLSHREPVPEITPVTITAPEPAADRDEFPFTFLGFRKDSDAPRFCFYSGASKTIISMGAGGINSQSILNLAPRTWWEQNYPSTKGINMDAISNLLISRSFSIGIFSESRIRGRGAWMDSGRTILHSGDHLIVDGQHTALGKIDTKFIYEQGYPMQMDVGSPIPSSTSGQLIDMLKLVSWERPVNAYLLAGWCVIAPVCGAIKWRPHIWVTGGAGTGKTWISKNVIRRLLGETPLAVNGKTTEPGIRSALGHDALPVIFDEADAEDQRSQERVQSILDLTRGSSTDDSGMLYQGSAGGGGVKTFRIRSSFCLLSVGIQTKQQSDRSRFTILALKRRMDDERKIYWEQLQSMYAHLVTDEFVSGLQARTISMLPIILKNAEVFNNAAVSILKEQRYGDQLGAMLAGAYSLKFDGLVTYDFARKWVEEMNWDEEKSLDANRDESRLLNFILEYQIEVENEYSRVKRSIGELVRIVIGVEVDGHVPYEQALKALLRIGIKIRDQKFIVSNSSTGIKSILDKTPWSGENHNKILLRIDGAVVIEPTSFGTVKHRGVGIPIEVLL